MTTETIQLVGEHWQTNIWASEFLDLDSDGDGDRDLLVTLVDLRTSQTLLRLLVNEGGRTFSDQTANRFDIPGHNGFWIDFSFLQDVDGDNDLDILADDWGNKLSWLNEGGLFHKQPIVSD